MSERWKTALNFGLIWGILMSLFTLLVDLQEKTFHEIITSNLFWVRAAGYTVLGIFPVGYFSYRKKKAD